MPILKARKIFVLLSYCTTRHFCVHTARKISYWIDRQITLPHTVPMHTRLKTFLITIVGLPVSKFWKSKIVRSAAKKYQIQFQIQFQVHFLFFLQIFVIFYDFPFLVGKKTDMYQKLQILAIYKICFMVNVSISFVTATFSKMWLPDLKIQNQC